MMKKTRILKAMIRGELSKREYLRLYQKERDALVKRKTERFYKTIR